MDGKTLMSAMSYAGYPAPMSVQRYTALAPAVNAALREAKCTTAARASMFLAQVGAESGSLRWMEELADGSAYNGRTDLGNTHPGDGPRFRGRGPIQVTGRHNYTRLSQWAHQTGYVPTADYFVEHPEKLATDQYGFLGAVWYWTVARNMNRYADAHDIEGATRAVNGGLNNLSGRAARWRKCLTLGDAILPDPAPHPTPKGFTVDQEAKARFDAQDVQIAALRKQAADLRTILVAAHTTESRWSQRIATLLAGKK